MNVETKLHETIIKTIILQNLKLLLRLSTSCRTLPDKYHTAPSSDIYGIIYREYKLSRKRVSVEDVTHSFLSPCSLFLTCMLCPNLSASKGYTYSKTVRNLGIICSILLPIAVIALCSVNVTSVTSFIFDRLLAQKK